MLQRSPTYVASRPATDTLSRTAHRFLPDRLAYGVLRAKNVLQSIWTYQMSRRKPQAVAKFLFDQAQEKLGHAPADPHFKPAYDPWDQRLCLVPDDDLFRVLREGSASIVTDHVERFDKDGIVLKGGGRIDCDLVVSATGLKLLPFGGVEMAIDGEVKPISDSYNYKGMMFSDTPNFAALFGYTNASWTLKIDLSARYFCRLVKEQRRRGADSFAPRMKGPAPEGEPIIDFDAGYVKRSIHLFPRQGPERPWRNHQNYVADALDIGLGRLDDGVMRFETARKAKVAA
jgi:cation diffusion facilitator CzcD-associated flavoprotein CzcO